MKKYFLLLLACYLFTQYGCSGNNNTTNEEQAGHTETAPVSTETGKQLFVRTCAPCHGEDGKAGISGAADLQESQLDSMAIRKTVSDGKGSMPAFNSVLGKEELSRVAAYVRTLQQ